MKIQTQERVISSGGGGVVIDPNFKKEREMLDKNGNVIDPRTKQIIRRADQEKI